MLLAHCSEDEKVLLTAYLALTPRVLPSLPRGTLSRPWLRTSPFSPPTNPSNTPRRRSTPPPSVNSHAHSTT